MRSIGALYPLVPLPEWSSILPPSGFTSKNLLLNLAAIYSSIVSVVLLESAKFSCAKSSTDYSAMLADFILHFGEAVTQGLFTPCKQQGSILGPLSRV